MAEKLFKLEIVTPSRVVFSGNVQSFSAPGVLGGFQVLYNHAPMLTMITVGEIKVRDENGNEFRYATTNGYVEVSSNEAIVVAEAVERSDEIDVERALASKKRAEERLNQREQAVDVARAQASLARASNRLKIAGMK
ncbi:MAG: F0F1 ATP synthase subunit epsilon [Candidatus Kryptoniota bacterium]